MFAQMRLLTMAGIFALSSTAFADITEDLLKQANAGGEGGNPLCLETAVEKMVQARQGQEAGKIIGSACALLPLLGEQQASLNCTSDIGGAAIGAGGNEAEVLAALATCATAAGLPPTGAGAAPANLGGIGGGTVGGGGGGVISPS